MRQLKIEERYTQRNDLVMRYFVDVEKEKMLSPNEEYAIAVRAANGDEEAIEKLVRANLRFVISVAKQYTVNPEMLNDLIAQGNIGLIDAAKSFDPSRGFKFISYAVWHVRKEIMLYLNNLKRTIRIPTNITQDINRIRKASSVLESKLGREPVASEISEQIEKMFLKPLDESRIAAILGYSSPISALESSSHEDGLAPIDWLDGDIGEFDEVDRVGIGILDQLLSNHLSWVEKDIVTRYHGIGYAGDETFISIARRHGKSAEWARQVYTKAIRRLRARVQRNRQKYGELLDQLT
jgi:RNA polymerase primary sigma factor